MLEFVADYVMLFYITDELSYEKGKKNLSKTEL